MQSPIRKRSQRTDLHAAAAAIVCRIRAAASRSNTQVLANRAQRGINFDHLTFARAIVHPGQHTITFHVLTQSLSSASMRRPPFKLWIVSIPSCRFRRDAPNGTASSTGTARSP
jgi:transposase